MQDHIMSRLDKIETALRVIKDNHLHHMESRLTKVEEGLSWIKGLLFSIIGINYSFINWYNNWSEVVNGNKPTNLKRTLDSC